MNIISQVYYYFIIFFIQFSPVNEITPGTIWHYKYGDENIYLSCIKEYRPESDETDLHVLHLLLSPTPYTGKNDEKGRLFIVKINRDTTITLIIKTGDEENTIGNYSSSPGQEISLAPDSHNVLKQIKTKAGAYVHIHENSSRITEKIIIAAVDTYKYRRDTATVTYNPEIGLLELVLNLTKVPKMYISLAKTQSTNK